MQPECRQHPTAQPEGLSKDYSARYSRGILSLSNYGPYKPCNPWHLSAGLVMCIHGVQPCTLLLFLAHIYKSLNAAFRFTNLSRDMYCAQSISHTVTKSKV